MAAPVISKRHSPRFLALLLFAAASALSSVPTPIRAQDADALRSGEGGQVRALIVGIDAYRHVRPLQGAAADARDIEQALRKTNVKDVTALVDSAVDRASVLSAIDSLIARSVPNDLILLSLAGHGAQEPERVKGSQPDGVENVFLLPSFEPTPTGSKERIFSSEFNHIIKQFELRGAHVLFVADTCYGGGMAREIDPRAEEMSFRQVPSYRLTVDLLKPISTSQDEMLTELDFDHTAFLAAVDRHTKSPEVRIPGIAGLRGALSYAVARAIEGSADSNRDGKTTLKELFSNLRQVVYQLSDQRQNIVATTSPSVDISGSIVFQAERSMAAKSQIASAAPAASAPRPAPKTVSIDRPIRLAALDGKNTYFAGLAPREAAFEVVRPVDNPDLIWDPVTHDVLAWTDVIAYRVEQSELPGIIDRAAAIHELKRMASRAPQSLKMFPDDSLHRKNSLVQLEVSDVGDRALILFNIAGDGTIQLLYPVSSDPEVLREAVFRFPVRVREPYGSDQLIAITAPRPMRELKEALQRLNRRRAPLQMINMILRYAPSDASIGSAGVFTAP